MKIEVIFNGETFKQVELVAETKKDNSILSDICFSEFFKEKYLKLFSKKNEELKGFSNAIIHTNSGTDKGMEAVGLMVYW